MNVEGRGKRKLRRPTSNIEWENEKGNLMTDKIFFYLRSLKVDGGQLLL